MDGDGLDTDGKSVGQSTQSVRASHRTMQVADMTTFMAKLMFKLTEMSCAHANQYIVSHNQILELEEREA